jgi:hypothetical protein
MNPKRVCRHLAVAVIAAGPVGGFLLGLLNPGDPDPNPIGRVVYSCMMAVQTPLHAGFPPHAQGQATVTLNAWPLIGVAFLLISGWLLGRERRAHAASRQ